jgi:hypothetical protein
MEIALYAPSVIKALVGEEMAKIILENQVELRKDCNELGLEKVREKRDLIRKDLESKYSELAEFLEDEGFETEKFMVQLNNDQFSWLISNIKEVKQHLRGIEL